MCKKHYWSDTVDAKSHEENLLERAQNSTDNWSDSGGLFSERNSEAVCKDLNLKPNDIVSKLLQP